VCDCSPERDLLLDRLWAREYDHLHNELRALLLGETVFSPLDVRVIITATIAQSLQVNLIRRDGSWKVSGKEGQCEDIVDGYQVTITKELRTGRGRDCLTRREDHV
jgi:hypothetical protein